MVFRITTWNVNGIRNPFSYQPWTENRTYQAMFDILEADIVVIQEAKIQRKDLQDDMVMLPGWDVYFSLPKHKKGYSGVAIYTRSSVCAPIRAEEGITGILCPPKSKVSYRDLPEEQRIGGYPRPGQLSAIIDEETLDSEGRCVILEFPAFVLIGVYSPANRDESRDDFRISFFEALDVRVRNLIAEGKQVILTGDLNVVGAAIDTSNLEETLRKNDMTFEDWANTPARRIFNQMIFQGSFTGPRDEGREKAVLWDICRFYHPDRQKMNTCWDTLRNTRPANLGSRIDYVLCSDGLKPWISHSNIQEGLMGSDHCPVYANFDDIIVKDGVSIPIQQVLNPATLFANGQRIRDWSTKDALPLSAKLMPEFDGRRSIKDMFSRKPSTLSKPDTPPQSTTLVPQVDIPNAPILSDSQSGVSDTKTPTALPDEPISGTKRGGSGSFAALATKRQKPIPETTGQMKTKVKPGQRTLQGFFKPKPSTNGHNSAKPQQSSEVLRSGSSTTIIAEARGVTASDTPPISQAKPQSSFDTAETVFDPIENKESWSKLLGKRIVPKCEHNEPCISLLTKKPGVNCGRSFYICPRPLGPSGEKERGTEWRCGTFIWSSDWNSSQKDSMNS